MRKHCPGFSVEPDILRANKSVCGQVDDQGCGAERVAEAHVPADSRDPLKCILLLPAFRASVQVAGFRIVEAAKGGRRKQCPSQGAAA